MLSLENLTLVNNAQMDNEGDLNIPNSNSVDPLGTGDGTMPTYQGSYPAPTPATPITAPTPIAVVEPPNPIDVPVASVEPPLIPNSHPIDDPVGTINTPDNDVYRSIFEAPIAAPAHAPAPAPAPAPISTIAEGEPFTSYDACVVYGPDSYECAVSKGEGGVVPILKKNTPPTPIPTKTTTPVIAPVGQNINYLVIGLGAVLVILIAGKLMSNSKN